MRIISTWLINQINTLIPNNHKTTFFWETWMKIISCWHDKTMTDIVYYLLLAQSYINFCDFHCDDKTQCLNKYLDTWFCFYFFIKIHNCIPISTLIVIFLTKWCCIFSVLSRTFWYIDHFGNIWHHRFIVLNIGKFFTFQW